MGPGAVNPSGGLRTGGFGERIERIRGMGEPRLWWPGLLV